MKSLSAAMATMFVLSCPAQAQPISKSVPANKTTTVFTYSPYSHVTCEGVSAVAKLAIKPQHGRVSHYLTPAHIPTINRFNGQPTGCAPKPNTGFAVTYTPDSGFHGTDTFSLDVEWEGNRRASDVFTIQVQ
jgi:hypothetical protein